MTAKMSESHDAILAAIDKLSDRQAHDREELLAEIRNLKSFQDLVLYRLTVLEKDMVPVKSTVDKVSWGMDISKAGGPLVLTLLAHAVATALYILKEVGYL
jgi:hypothetical protein